VSQEVQSKILGVSSEATLVLPIRQGAVPGENRTWRVRLEHNLESLQRRAAAGVPTPVPLLRTIHSARWHIYDPPAGHAVLIFCVTFDGRLKHYFRRFSHGIPDDIDRIFGNCEGYPEQGAKEFDALWRWVKEHQIEATMFYSAYPDLTLTDIDNLRTFKRNFEVWAAEHLEASESADSEPGAAISEFLRTEHHRANS
jgi:hypothetical protein